MRFPGFVGPSYVSQSPLAAIQRCMNWYVEQIEVGGESAQSVLYPTPGCATFWADGEAPAESPVRGMTEQNGRCFAVVGQKLYEIFSDGTKTDRSPSGVARDNNPAVFAANVDAGDELFITSGDKGYVLTLSTSVLTTEITSGANQCAFLDGFFLVLDDATSTLKVSGLNDGTTWEASQVAQRTAGSDPWQAMVVVHRDIWLFGKQTSEVWYNAGTSPFPFAAIPGAFLEQGIIAPFSATAVGNTVMWLGANRDGSGMVFMADGYSPVRISTHAVEHALQDYVRAGITIADAVAFTYQEDGHTFYVLNFPTAKATWVYDSSTQLWHERGTWDADATQYEAWRPQSHCFAFNKHLVGDRALGTVYEMSLDNYTDAGGGVLRRMRRTPHVTVEQQSLFYHKFQIELETGLGLSAGQGEDPQAMVRWSDDGGQTWGHEHWVSAGKQGQYNARAVWRRLGRGRNRVFEVVVTDPIPWRMIQAFLDISRGTS